MTPPSNGHSTGPSVGPLVGVLALQGDVREHRVMLERAGARTIAVRRPEEVERVDGIVIPGGESTTISKLASTFGVLDPLREDPAFRQFMSELKASWEAARVRYAR